MQDVMNVWGSLAQKWFLVKLVTVGGQHAVEMFASAKSVQFGSPTIRTGDYDTMINALVRATELTMRWEAADASLRLPNID